MTEPNASCTPWSERPSRPQDGASLVVYVLAVPFSKEAESSLAFYQAVTLRHPSIPGSSIARFPSSLRYTSWTGRRLRRSPVTLGSRVPLGCCPTPPRQRVPSRGAPLRTAATSSTSHARPWQDPPLRRVSVAVTKPSQSTAHAPAPDG